MELKSEKLKPILTQFLSNCNYYTLFAIKNIYESNSQDIERDSLLKVREYIKDLLLQIEQNIKSTSCEDLDAFMEMKKIYQAGLEFLTDLEKLNKLFKKKEIDTNYVEIFSSLYRLLAERLDEENEQMIKCQFFRIKNSLNENITLETVIKEIIQSPLDIKKNEDTCKKILNKFNIEYNPSKLSGIIKEIIDDIELDDFENNLGINNAAYSLPDYTTLNGYEFEEFLKELFTALDYIVVKTPLSNDKGADLVISKDGVLTVVQAKKYSAKVSNKAIQEVVAAKAVYNCEKALVVATNEFTKSAVELAMSNKVELWDKHKLDETLDSINNVARQNYSNLQNGIIENDLIDVSCLCCISKFKISVDQVPQRYEKMRITCPVCGISYFMEVPDDLYICSGCNQEFDFIKDLLEHESSCEKL